MIQFLVWLTFIMAPLSWYQGRYNWEITNPKLILRGIYTSCFVGPILEEVVFRQLLPHFLGVIFPGNWISTIRMTLFGFSHYHNPEVGGYNLPQSLRLLQCFSASYVDWKLSPLVLEDRIWYHCLLNLIQVIILLTTFYLTRKPKIKEPVKIESPKIRCLLVRSQSTNSLYQKVRLRSDWGTFREPKDPNFERFSRLIDRW